MPNSASKQTPSIGNLSALQSELNTASQPKGDTPNAEAAANDVLGDITLLEEAFAEMEVSVADYEQEIPMVNSSIDTPVEKAELSTQDSSIPTLDQPPSEIVENNQEEATSEPLAILDEDIPTLDAESGIEELAISSVKPIDETSAISEQTDHVEVLIGEPAEQNTQSSDTSELETETTSSIITLDTSDIAMESLMASLEDEPEEAEDIVPTLTSTAECTSQMSSVAAEIAEDETDDTPDSITELPEVDEVQEESFSSLVDDLDGPSESSIAQTSDPISIINDETFSSDLPSIEEKIAQATIDSHLSALSEIALTDQDQVITELAPDLPEDQVTPETTPSPNTPSMSIPFELHSQLSKKIDDLVLDATLSLTTELQTQLSLQLESLLSNAVEAVLPKLVDQMANELRAEVKGRVQQQLPIIVNEVLGKTRLS